MFNSIVIKQNKYFSEAVLFNSTPAKEVASPTQGTYTEQINNFLNFDPASVVLDEETQELIELISQPSEKIERTNEKDGCVLDEHKLIDTATGEVLRDYEEESKARARRKVVEIGRNNDWNFFCTFTFDNRKVKNIDITTKEGQEEALSAFLKTIDNFKQSYAPTLRYLVVPELGGKNKRLHFHGLFFLENRHLLKRVKYNKKRKMNMYRIDYFFKKFGANTFYEITEDCVAVSLYCSKYITKDEALQIKSHRYFASKGLKRDKVVDGYKFNNKLVESCERVLTRFTKKETKAVFSCDHCKKFRLTKEIFERFMLFFDQIKEAFTVEPKSKKCEQIKLAV